MEVVPLVHCDGSVTPLSEPKLPVVTVHPVAGLTVQTVAPGLQPVLDAVLVGMPLLVKFTGTLTQAVSAPNVNDALAACET